MRPSTARVKSQLLKRKDYPELPGKYWGNVFHVAKLGPGVIQIFVEFFPETSHKRHRHPKHAETVFVFSGAIMQMIDDKATVRLEAGDTAFIPRGAWHSATPLKKNTVVFVTLCGKGDEYVSEEQELPNDDGKVLKRIRRKAR